MANSRKKKPRQVQKYKQTMARSSKKKPKLVLYLRLNPQLHDKVSQAADEAKLTMTDLVCQILERRFADRSEDIPVLSSEHNALVKEFTNLLLYDAECDKYMAPHVVGHLEDPAHKAEREEARKINLRRSRT